MGRFLALLLLAWPLCAGAETTLRIALQEDADALDPTIARTFVGRIVFAGLCDKLFDINEKLEIVPQLATAYEWADPVTLVIHLRDGVKFQDGTRMDAAAVKYSLERHLNLPGSFRKSEINLMDRVEVVDPLTVRIVLKSPFAPFVAQLTDRSGMIVSPKAAEAAGADFGNHPVCAGPFSFVERVPQDRIVLQRFPGYWNAGAIKVDRVVYQPIPDSSVRLANLQAGSADMDQFVLPTDADAVRKNPKLRLVVSDWLAYQTIEFNVANGARADTPFGRDPRVRRAFELSLDREALTQVVYAGVYTPTDQTAPPPSPFYMKQFQPAGRDVAAARALLKEAGLDRVKLNLTVPNNPDLRQAAEVMQSMAAEAGFDVQITLQEFASALTAANRGDFQAFMTAWSGRPDIDGNTWSFLHTGGALNDGHWSDAEVDAALDDARGHTDPAVRMADYAKAWQRVLAQVPILYLWSQKTVVGLSDKVQGYKPIPDGIIRIQGISLAQ